MTSTDGIYLNGELIVEGDTTGPVSARTILEVAREVGSDLIVLGASQRKGIERALIGSVTADVIRDAHRDVLIIPVNAPE